MKTKTTTTNEIPFKTYHRYRHMACFDIDIDVFKVLGENETLVSLIVNYWNRHLKGYQGGRPQVVSVQKSDFWKWKEIPLEHSIKGMG